MWLCVILHKLLLGGNNSEAEYVNTISPISSMKIIQGWIFTANEKTAAVSFCDSPYHLSVNVEACKLMNWHPEALAVALAINVFPHPGGPYNNTPATKVGKCYFWIPPGGIFIWFKGCTFLIQPLYSFISCNCLLMAVYLTLRQGLRLPSTGQKRWLSQTSGWLKKFGSCKEVAFLKW